MVPYISICVNSVLVFYPWSLDTASNRAIDSCGFTKTGAIVVEYLDSIAFEFIYLFGCFVYLFIMRALLLGVESSLLVLMRIEYLHGFCCLCSTLVE